MLAGASRRVLARAPTAPFQRSSHSWAARRNGRLVSPTPAQTNAYILRLRQNGDSLSKALAYVRDIIDAGFQPSDDTLAALIHTDALPPEQLVQLTTQLRLRAVPRHLPVSWSKLFVNHLLVQAGSDWSERLQRALSTYDSAKHLSLPDDIVLDLLRHVAGNDSLAVRIMSSLAHRLSKAGVSLMAAHTRVRYTNRTLLVRRVFDLLESRNELLHEMAAVHECIKAVWLSDDHSQALSHVLTWAGSSGVREVDLRLVWTIVCYTQYNQSYTMPLTGLMTFRAETTQLGFALDDYMDNMLSTFLQAHATISRGLTQRKSTLSILEQGRAQQHADSTLSVVDAILPMLGDRDDYPATRRALVEVAAAAGRTGLLMRVFLSQCEHAAEVDQDALLVALVACEQSDDLPTARRLLRAPIAICGPYAPREDVWAQWIRCLAQGNALDEALAVLRARLPNEPRYHAPVLRVLQCAFRMGRIQQVQEHLARNKRSILAHPNVLKFLTQLKNRKPPQDAAACVDQSHPLASTERGLLPELPTILKAPYGIGEASRRTQTRTQQAVAGSDAARPSHAVSRAPNGNGKALRWTRTQPVRGGDALEQPVASRA